ncbi:MAG: NAD-dependent dehydratase [Planctomycetaceae bacterium]|nr:NAD-dependent dehydratase [Planctomycetaceae bacterium]MBP63329.1 NAD-dependent dehydratase [Planctomycetaceae bacterium]
MKWSGAKVVVTGAGGFIGSHLCELLVREGAELTAFVRYTSRGNWGLLDMVEPDVSQNIQVVTGDLRDPEAVRNVVRGHETIFHLGALIAIPYSYQHPTEVAQVNVVGTLNVLNAAREFGISRVLHTSTSEVYGTAQTVPISESHPLSAQSPYSASKIGADALAMSYHCSFGLPLATVRPFNTYGPRQSGRAVIPTIIGQALNAGRVKLGSLTPTRDFLFVKDTVAGFLAVANCDKTIGKTVNLGTGSEISIGDLAAKIVERTGCDVSIESEEERMRPDNSEVFRLVCDAERARSWTGWEPTYSLDAGLDEVIDFMRSHPHWTKSRRYEV